MLSCEEAIALGKAGDNDLKIGRHRSLNPYKDLAAASLDQGVKENDRNADDEMLHLLCGVAEMQEEDYYKALDFYYGPINKEGKDV